MYGYGASAQPQIIAATAAVALTREATNLRLTSRPRESTPATAETTRHGNARPKSSS
jgi:hypothetical protein